MTNFPGNLSVKSKRELLTVLRNGHFLHCIRWPKTQLFRKPSLIATPHNNFNLTMVMMEAYLIYRSMRP